MAHQPLSPLALEEFKALRATIRERGHLRLIVSTITFVAWATLASGVLPLTPLFALLVPLVVLAGGFEVVFAAHVGVERVGRYLAVNYETTEGVLPAWERTAARLGQDPRAATGIDPLFTRVFGIALLVNLVSLARVGWVPEVTHLIGVLLLIAAHLGFGLRLVRAQAFAQSQRTRDEELFRRAGL